MNAIRLNFGHFLLLLLACTYSSLWAQGGYSLTASPNYIPAGGQAFSLNINFSLGSNPAPSPKPNWAARWNGSLRPTTVQGSSYQWQLVASIPASDIARPGFVEISVVDQATGVVLPTVSWILITADVNVSDFAYDAVRSRFYVSVPTGASRPNAPAESIVSIDAATGAVLNSLNVGSKPTLLAISGDATFLYVYLSGSLAISRIALGTFTPDIQIPLPAKTNLSWMEVMPGSPRTLVTALQTTGTSGTGSIIVYDDAQSRPNTAPGAPARFVFTDPGTIVGGFYNNYMSTWKITATGLGPATVMTNTSYDLPLAYTDGWILSSRGILTYIAGTSSSWPLDLAGIGAFVPGFNRVLIFQGQNGSGTGQLGAFDYYSLNALGRISITQAYNPYPTTPVPRMVVWGTDGVAFVANQELFIGHTPLAAAPPAITAAGILNAASLTSGSVSPGEIISIFGTNLGETTGRSLEFSEPRQVSTVLGGSQVWFDGLPGTMLYAGSGQINAIAPFGLSGKTSTRVQVWNRGIPSMILPLQVSSTSPGIFTQNASGQGAACILNSDGSVNSPSQPAPAGSIVSLYANGGGVTRPLLADGQQDIHPATLAGGVQVFLNGASVPILYAGSAPDLVAGVVQVNFQIPSDFPPTAAATVQLSIDGIVSPTGVTISTR